MYNLKICQQIDFPGIGLPGVENTPTPSGIILHTSTVDHHLGVGLPIGRYGDFQPLGRDFRSLGGIFRLLGRELRLLGRDFRPLDLVSTVLDPVSRFLDPVSRVLDPKSWI